MVDEKDGWNEWEKHVLFELKRLGNGQESTNKAMKNIAVEIGMLKVKSGIWGAIGASVPLLIFVAIQILTNNHP